MRAWNYIPEIMTYTLKFVGINLGDFDYAAQQ